MKGNAMNRNKTTLDKIPEAIYDLMENTGKRVYVSGKCGPGWLKRIYVMGESYRINIKRDDNNDSGEYRFIKEDLKNILVSIY